MALLTREAIIDALGRLDARLAARGVRAELFLVGGAGLLLEEMFDVKESRTTPPLMLDIDKAKLYDWMRTRIGYGNLAARGWFLGMEESCKGASELARRIEGGPVEDLEDALRRIGGPDELLRNEPAL